MSPGNGLAGEGEFGLLGSADAGHIRCLGDVCDYPKL